MECDSARRIAVLVAVLLAAGCATRTAPPLPSAPAHPDFIYPVVPAGMPAGDGAAAIDRGWRYLQTDDLRNAEREFSEALKRAPGLYPAMAANGYVALARDDFEEAQARFDVALRVSPAYVPALVGRGQALLELKRDAEALAAFEAALAIDESLANVRRRADVLQFRGVQDLIESARTAAAAGRLPEAAQAYERALAASPDTAFLYRELGTVAERQGSTDAALGHFRRALELEPGDAMLLTRIGELLEARRDFAGAEEAYRRAAEIEPGADLSARLAAVAERARDARLPDEFRAIQASTQLTRGDLAALMGVRFEEVLRTASPREVVMTDVAGHWAAPWITLVARAGVMDPFPNHAFEPRDRITRGDLAGAVSRLVTLLAARRPALKAHLSARPRIADMAAAHLSYPAAAVAVDAGVMPLAAGERFEVARPVAGAEAVEVIGRLRALAGAIR